MPLLYEKHDHVGILTLSRPEARNAWHQEFATGLQEQLPELEEDRDIRCVILTGDDTGGAFSAGADLKNPRTHTQNSIADFIEGLPHRRRSSPIVQVADFAKPVVAAVNGYAIGIGCILTLCCDLMSSRRIRPRVIEPGANGANRNSRGADELPP
jgi:enoyl-CoA hydratase/carnithine racemase